MAQQPPPVGTVTVPYTTGFQQSYGIDIAGDGSFALVAETSSVVRIALRSGTMPTIKDRGFKNPVAVAIAAARSFALVAKKSNHNVARIDLHTKKVTLIQHPCFHHADDVAIAPDARSARPPLVAPRSCDHIITSSSTAVSSAE